MKGIEVARNTRGGGALVEIFYIGQLFERLFWNIFKRLEIHFNRL